MRLKASAPGSLLLLGEYAVLSGKKALVCAVDKRITVTFHPRSDQKIIIHSALHGRHETDLTEIHVVKPFHFVLSVLKTYQAQLNSGCEVFIESNFSDKIGFGSSAAVTVALLMVIRSKLNLPVSELELVAAAREIIKQVQGLGSGADVAASVYGGLIAYQAQPLVIEKFSDLYPLAALYAGFKTPTPEAVSRVQQNFAAYPQLYAQLMESIGLCAEEGITLVKNSAWRQLGDIMNIQQGLLESLGVSTPLLNEMVYALRAEPKVHGAKISGAGLGDCVIGLGEVSASFAITYQSAVERIPVAMSKQGVICEKI